MKDCQNANFRIHNLVEKGKRKSSNNDTANSVMDLGICFGTAANPLNCFVDAEDKLRAETLSLMFIPDDRISKLPLGFRMETNSHLRLLRLKKISLDLFPRATLRKGLRTSIKFFLLSFGKLEGFVFSRNTIPDFLDGKFLTSRQLAEYITELFLSSIDKQSS